MQFMIKNKMGDARRISSTRARANARRRSAEGASKKAALCAADEPPFSSIFTNSSYKEIFHCCSKSKLFYRGDEAVLVEKK